MRRVLIVDDDPDFVAYVCSVLESHDYHVTGAVDLAQGLSALSRDHFELVILDVIMSGLFDGLSLRKQMAEDEVYRSIPILMVTSIRNADYLALFPEDESVRPNAFLTKPIAPAELLRQVERLLPVTASPST